MTAAKTAAELGARTFCMTIDGRPTPGRARFPVTDPATGQRFAEAPDCTREELDQAFAAAQAVFDAWSRDEPERCRCMLASATVLRDHAQELAEILTAEQGKPLADAALEVEYSALWLEYFATLERPREILQDDAAAKVELVRRPLGVVAAIAPWNVPLALAMWKVAPALRAGNTVVLKPSPFTPLATLLMGELLQQVLPAGVLSVVSGVDELGAWMTRHPVPRKVSFTGSVATGKRVAVAAAADLKRVTLELGGNDPAIILDHADLAAVIPAIFWSAFSNTGQVCVAVKRLYVPTRLHNTVVDGLAELAKQVRVGPGRAEGVQLGPLNNAPQLQRVTQLVDDALRAGAKPAAGGRAPEGQGYFYEPTILAGAADGMRVVDEEQFGPVLPVIPYDDVDQAVAHANASTFGLGGSVWGSELDHASEVARRLQCGTAWVNTHMALSPSLPFGGWKWSGIGLENGPWGLHSFTDVQVIHQTHAVTSPQVPA
jgi:acyl-CoA reductase-like NAD-dependent aldehyde dehydrogenase